jgi:hypothetical protein
MSYGTSVAKAIRRAAGWIPGARRDASDAADGDDEFHDRLNRSYALSARAKKAKRKAQRGC